MKTYQNESFHDRTKQAAKAKDKALEQLRSRPPMDPAVVAERKAASESRQAAESAKRAARAASDQALKDDKIARDAEAAAKLAAVKPERTEAERKLARDARYAARKNRK